MNEDSILPIEMPEGVDAKMLQVVVWPDERLAQPSAVVEDFDDDLKQLVIDMFYTMRYSAGIGLAAPQVGVNKRVIVLMLEQPVILINPVIITQAGEQVFEEGCLSVPGYFAKVKRAEQIRIGYQDVNGEPQELSASGFSAVVIQHEIDHINGKVFVDHLSGFKRTRAKLKVKKTLRQRS